MIKWEQVPEPIQETILRLGNKLIYCIDCKHCHEEGKAYYCDELNRYVTRYWECPWSERKEDE